MSTNGKIENGVNHSYGSITPSAENDDHRPIQRSPHESWCHVESGDQSPELRSQRRHFKDFNRSSIFDFGQSPSPTPPTPPIEEETKPVDPDQQISMKHKQKRHFENKNQSSLEM